MKNYVTNFLKTSPRLISKNYGLRIRSPKLRDIIALTSKEKENSVKLLYPTGGMERSVEPLLKRIKRKKVQIKTNSEIQRIVHSDNKVYVKIKESDIEQEFTFDKIIWTFSISDLLDLLNLEKFNKFRYRDLLLVNCAVLLDDLLGKNIQSSYVMIPDVPFHRVYEPKKLCPTMAPNQKTSICMEITLVKKKDYDIQELVENSIKALQKIFSIPENV